MEQNLSPEHDLWEREERCRKAIKTVTKAIAMRLLVTAVLIWSVFRNDMELWVAGLLSLMLLLNLVGAMPLVKEWKIQRRTLKQLIEQEPET